MDVVPEQGIHQPPQAGQDVVPQELEHGRILAGQARTGHEPRIHGGHGDGAVWDALGEPGMQGVRPQHVCEFGVAVVQAAVSFGEGRRRVRQVVGRRVHGHGHAGGERRVVDPAGRDHDAGALGEARAQQVEEQCVSGVRDAEGGFDAVFRGDHFARGRELQRGVEQQSLDGRVLVLGPLAGKGTYAGRVGEVEREVGGVLLAERLVDGQGGLLGVGPRA